MPVEVQFYAVFLGLWFIIEGSWQTRRLPLSIGLLLICAPYLRKATVTYVSVWIDPIVIRSMPSRPTCWWT